MHEASVNTQTETNSALTPKNRVATVRPPIKHCASHGSSVRRRVSERDARLILWITFIHHFFSRFLQLSLYLFHLLLLPLITPCGSLQLFSLFLRMPSIVLCVRGKRRHQLLKRHLFRHRFSLHAICVQPTADVRRFASVVLPLRIAVCSLERVDCTSMRMSASTCNLPIRWNLHSSVSNKSQAFLTHVRFSRSKCSWKESKLLSITKSLTFPLTTFEKNTGTPVR